MYKIGKHAPYSIQGVKAKYQIPAPEMIDFDDYDDFDVFNRSNSQREKGEIAKKFLLKYAPALADEGISDVEYLLIFSDYNSSYGNRQGE